MTDQPMRMKTKNERADELARAGGRDGWALVLAACDIADAIRELTAAISAQGVSIQLDELMPGPTTVVTPKPGRSTR